MLNYYINDNFYKIRIINNDLNRLIIYSFYELIKMIKIKSKIMLFQLMEISTPIIKSINKLFHYCIRNDFNCRLLYGL